MLRYENEGTTLSVKLPRTDYKVYMMANYSKETDTYHTKLYIMRNDVEDLNQMVDDYCYKNNLESAYTLDVIERDTTVRSLFEDMVNNLLEKYNLSENNINVYQETIFKGE